MRRKAWAVVLIGLLGGCTSTGGIDHGGGPPVRYGKKGPPTVPGVMGPYGEKIPMAAPYAYSPPPNNYTANQMMARSVPLGMVQFNQPGMSGPGGMGPSPIMPAGGMLSPPGVPFLPGSPGGMPGGPGMGGMPPGMGAMPGMPPGMSGMPGGPAIRPTSFAPGSPQSNVINAHIAPGQMPPGSVVLAQGRAPGGADAMRFPTTRSQVKFTRPSGMKVYWYTRGPDGKDAYSTTPIETPGRYNFAPGVYRLKLANIPGRPGVDLYPTLEVVPCNPKTEAFLAHNAVPVNFTDYDFKQVAEGNYLVKVIYLPDPQFQDVAGTGIDEILNNPLEPGMDPIKEALRRGSILMVIRMGNVDQEAPNTPPLVSGPAAGGMAPPGFMGPGGMMPPGMAPDPRMGPLFQVPMYGKPPGPLTPPPGLSGVPLPGGTPLPPGIGGSTAKPPTGLIPPPDVAPGITAPPALPGGPLGIPSAPLLEESKAPTPVPSEPPPTTPTSAPTKGAETTLSVSPVLAPTPTTKLPATPITPPPLPTVSGPGLTLPPPLPELPVVTPPPALPPALPPTLPPFTPGGSLEPALPGLPPGPTSMTPPTAPTVAGLAGGR